MRSKSPGTLDRWASVFFTETFTGAGGTFGPSTVQKSVGQNMVIAGSSIVIPQDGPYLFLAMGAISNTAAAKIGSVNMMRNGAGGVTVMLFVNSAGGSDISTSHAVIPCYAGDVITMMRDHSDTGNNRQMWGEMTVKGLS